MKIHDYVDISLDKTGSCSNSAFYWASLELEFKSELVSRIIVLSSLIQSSKCIEIKQTTKYRLLVKHDFNYVLNIEKGLSGFNWEKLSLCLYI